ncbi:MAG TPA: plastocyanin/azurin family copper-binding protein [Actinomycetota bacterium]|nr:plastocyanin/azurin family copper-binding protein [Actinomycetota bacterium]
MKKRSLLAALASVSVLSSCGGSADAPDAHTKSVTVQHVAFDPPVLEVTPGTEVTWTNRDAQVVHTATSGAPGDKGVPGLDNGTPPKPDGVFDGEMDGAGAAFSFTFEEAGTYAYFCRVHQSMTGEVVVR